uniref:Uncharacterized 7.3 kDa protein in 100 kDa protein region n=1 Tax=Human adenovirus F serotype 41 TaxID=10524 RepID=YL14_ADE41|nr:RecName: Full=Uncharacterized 7.3 kDa protein in 100 kDa protein region [Human adenovirus 41]CAA36764.1 unnamed protein product [Human adenovirus 41]
MPAASLESLLPPPPGKLPSPPLRPHGKFQRRRIARMPLPLQPLHTPPLFGLQYRAAQRNPSDRYL